MTKKMTIVVALAMCAFAAFARPYGGPGFRPMHRPPMIHHAPYYHHHYSGWGRGGRYFWPGFVGGVVGGVVSSAIAPAPVVVTTPTVVSTPVVTSPVVTTPVVTQPVVQKVWVPGTYVDQIQANGTVVRVWQPGHWEYR